MKTHLPMDQVTRSSASKNSSHTNDGQQSNASLGKLQRSALVNASGLIGDLVAMALPPAPQIRVSPNSRIASTLSDEVYPDENPMGTTVPQVVSLSATDKLEIASLPDGNLRLSLASTLSDDLLIRLVLAQSQNIDPRLVTEVSLSFCKNLTGTALQFLSERFPALNNLNLTGCSQFNDDEIAHVAQMVNLTNLSLAGCHGVSKTGLINLSSLLDNVEKLDLTHCAQVDDELLASLPNMHQIKHLMLTACATFTNTGLRELGKLKKLESLIMDQCPQISDVGLRKINHASGFRKLTQINLSNCPLVTQHGVFDLKQRLKGLQHVNVDR